MSTAQHLQSHASREPRSMSSVEEQAAEQARELQHLREELRQMRCDAERHQQRAKGSALSADDEREGQRLEEELDDLQEELANIGEEANRKIEAANSKIRVLRDERDVAVRDVESRIADLRRFTEERDELLSEREGLAQQKDALLKIVEDLHQTCVSAGLQLSAFVGGRASIDSFRFP